MPKLQLGGRATPQSSEGPPAAAFTDVPAERDAAAKLRAVEEADPKVGHPSPSSAASASAAARAPPPAPAAAAAALAAAPDRRTHAPRCTASATSVAGTRTAVQPAAAILGAPLEEAPGVSVSRVLAR